MLLKKIHHLKTKIKTHISNMDLLDIVVEDNSSIRKEINELKNEGIEVQTIPWINDKEN